MSNQKLNQVPQQAAMSQWTNQTPATQSVLTTSSNQWNQLGSNQLGGISTTAYPSIGGGLTGALYPSYPYYAQTVLANGWTIEKAENGFILRTNGKVYLCLKKEDLIQFIE